MIGRHSTQANRGRHRLRGTFLSGRWPHDQRGLAGLLALLLLLVGLHLAWQAEQEAGNERSRQTVVQARILAGSVAGALAFDDQPTAREFLNALQINENIQAAAIYGSHGERIAGFVKSGRPLPSQVQAHAPARADGVLTVVEPVQQGTLRLGTVYVRAVIEPWQRRASRYFGIGAVLLMAALLIAALGAANASSIAANRRLQQEIDAREEAELQLRQAQKMEAIGQLTGGVAHDFNNMLMAASSGLELLERSTDPARREKLRLGIRDALDRGAKLTQQLLTFARRTPFKREVIDVDEHLKGLSGLLERSLRENIAIHYDLAPGLWAIDVDPSQFDVAIVNIAVNARDAMPHGGALRISATNAPAALAGEDAVEIRISDQGAGMTPEQVERAFEPFFTTKGVGHGTGLGLSQVYGFTRAAGGRATLESAPAQGTAVVMLLPRSALAPEPARTLATDSVEGEQLRWRALLVEDDNALAELIAQMLAELGCAVERKASAQEAICGFDRKSVDFVLSDMVMPGNLNGLEFARQLRSRWPDLPLVLMTGFSDAASPAIAEGFEVLSKPFTFATLARTLRTIQSFRGGAM